MISLDIIRICLANLRVVLKSMGLLFYVFHYNQIISEILSFCMTLEAMSIYWKNVKVQQISYDTLQMEGISPAYGEIKQ